MDNKVDCYLKSENGMKYDGKVVILEILEENNTFIHNGILCSSKKCIVKYEDGFKTKRNIYYIVETTDDDSIPENYVERYSYNLEKPYIDITDELSDEYGGNF